jgi:hypothetical protein
MDTRTERLIRDNAEVEHMLLTPFRWFANLMKGALVALFCLFILGFNATWWLVGCGSMGILDRQERAGAFVKDIGDNNSGVADYWVSFDARENATTKDNIESLREARANKETWEIQSIGDTYQSSGADASQIEGDGPNDPLQFCSAKASDQEPGMGLKGLFDRSRSVFGRKASRMYEAYVSGAVSVTALRVTLTELKLGRDPLTTLTAEPGQVNSLCRVDPFDVISAPDADYQRWYKTSISVKLDAPDIHMRMVKDDWKVPFPRVLRTYAVDHAYHKGWIISGMCLQSECQEGLDSDEDYRGQQDKYTRNEYLKDDRNFYSTMCADLFYSIPPLSAHQTNAVEALNHLATDEYWIAQAHKNGIYDDATVKAMAAKARYTVSKEIAPDKVPQMGEGEASINVLGGQ